jgi:selenide,water dikinase
MTPVYHPTEGSPELVLVGGGHVHALLLLELGKKPLPGVGVTLVSDTAQAAYSGMLPGHIAGSYGRAEMHIDLPRLCNFARTRFILGSANRLDLEQRKVHLANTSVPLSADVVSINIGSLPSMEDVAGADIHAIPAKPVSRLLAGWARVRATARLSIRPLRIIVAGGGAGGVELALAMHSQLRSKAEFTIVHGLPDLLPGHGSHVQHILLKLLRERRLNLITGKRVVKVTASHVNLDDGQLLAADFVFWATHATPPAWLQESGLDTTPEGFIRVRATLQALNYSWIFAAGDAATMENRKLPKSGVFAVRMAQPLEHNLRAYLSGGVLTDCNPQRHSLSLIGTADGRAIASYGWLGGRSVLFWKWKKRIDLRFMKQFQSSPGGPTSET